MNLVINLVTKNGTNILQLQGEVDVYTSVQLKQHLITLTNQKNSKTVVDLTNVSYIDSTGLGIFIGALKSSHENNSSFKLVGMNERVRRLFRITGLDEVIEIEDSTREEAK